MNSKATGNEAVFSGLVEDCNRSTLAPRQVDEGYAKPTYAHLRKLTVADAEEIIQLAQAGWSQRAIGERYGCNRSMVWKILRGISFWWATGLPKAPLSAKRRMQTVDR